MHVSATAISQNVSLGSSGRQIQSALRQSFTFVCSSQLTSLSHLSHSFHSQARSSERCSTSVHSTGSSLVLWISSRQVISLASLHFSLRRLRMLPLRLSFRNLRTQRRLTRQRTSSQSHSRRMLILIHSRNSISV